MEELNRHPSPEATVYERPKGYEKLTEPVKEAWDKLPAFEAAANNAKDVVELAQAVVDYGVTNEEGRAVMVVWLSWGTSIPTYEYDGAEELTPTIALLQKISNEKNEDVRIELMDQLNFKPIQQALKRIYGFKQLESEQA